MPSPTWILFDNSTGAEVALSLYAPPGGSNRPVDAYVITECEGAFTRAARRAAESCYQQVKKVKEETAAIVVGYDLQGVSGSTNFTGESGGLGMAIALAKTLLDDDPGPVAATGVLMPEQGDCSIAAVTGIAGKVDAATQLLPDGGILLYPAANQNEFTDGMLQSLSDQGIICHPVTTLGEALGILFPTVFSQPTASSSQPASRNSLLWAGILVLLAVIVTAWTFWPSASNMDSEPAITKQPATQTQPTSAPAHKPDEEAPPTESKTHQITATKTATKAESQSSSNEQPVTEKTINQTETLKAVPDPDKATTIPSGKGFD